MSSWQTSARDGASCQRASSGDDARITTNPPPTCHWGGSWGIGSFTAPSVALHPRRKHHTLVDPNMHHACQDPQDEVVVNPLGSLTVPTTAIHGLARCMRVGDTSCNKSR